MRLREDLQIPSSPLSLSLHVETISGVLWMPFKMEQQHFTMVITFAKPNLGLRVYLQEADSSQQASLDTFVNILNTDCTTPCSRQGRRVRNPARSSGGNRRHPPSTAGPRAHHERLLHIRDANPTQTNEIPRTPSRKRM